MAAEVGKRYTDEESKAEVIVTKKGEVTLYVVNTKTGEKRELVKK